MAWATAALFIAVTGPPAAFFATSRSPSLVSVLLLVVLYAALSRIEFEVASVTVVASELAFIPMLAILPAPAVPLCVALAFVVAYLPDVLRGRLHPGRIIQLIGDSWFSVGPAVLILVAGEPKASLGELPIYAAALIAQLGTDSTVTAIREYAAKNLSPRMLLRPMSWLFLVDGLLFPMGFLTAVASANKPAMALLSAPIGLLMFVFSRERQAHIGSTLELSNAYRGTAFLLGDVVEADDAYTGSHSRDVVDLVLAVADRLQLDAKDRRKAEFTALLHDIGKLRIPNEIINKPGPLTPQEREIINTHTIEGENLLTRVGGLLGEVGHLVRSCHEHYDGSGYPDHLAADNIPLISRIVCCCDAYNAMTTTRPYRAALSESEAANELRRCAGTQFDPRIVDALLQR